MKDTEEIVIKIRPRKKEYEFILDLFPPISANKFLPEWYKNMSLGNKMDFFKHQNASNQDDIELGDKALNAKNCPAIQDLVSTGIIIPLWSDFFYKVNYDNSGKAQSYSWDFKLGDALEEPIDYHIGKHSKLQTEGMDLAYTLDGAVLKFCLPYIIEPPKGYNIMYTDPFYHFRKKIKCLSGIVESDKWNQITFPFSIEEDEFLIEAGEPLIHVFPYKRDKSKIVLDIDVGTEEDYYQYNKEFKEVVITGKNYRTNK